MLFIKNELALVCVFACRSTQIVFFLIDLHCNCEAIQVLCRLFSHTLPRTGKDKSIMRVAQYTLALQRYRGGHPVPRAASLYDGGVQIYANKLTHVGYFSLLFALFFFSNNQIAGLSSDRHPFG